MVVDLPDTLEIVVVSSDDEPMEGFEGNLEEEDDLDNDQEIDEVVEEQQIDQKIDEIVKEQQMHQEVNKEVRE